MDGKMALAYSSGATSEILEPRNMPPLNVLVGSPKSVRSLGGEQGPDASEHARQEQQLVPPIDSANHVRQPSDSGYSLIDYYAESYDGQGSNAGASEEPFTLITANSERPPETTTTAARRTALTRTESYASLQRSRTSLEQIRNQIDQSLLTNTQLESPTDRRHKKNTRKSVLASDRDRYGFKKANHYVSLQEYNTWWNEYSPYLARRKRKWEKLMAKNGLHTTRENAPTRFPARSEDLRRYVRKGIPAEWRGNAWFYFTRGHDRLKENIGVYDRLVDETMDMINENTEAIEKDLHRTFPENVHFNNVRSSGERGERGEPVEAESALLQTLRRVLKCFSKYRPTIGYCQSLNFIAGLLLVFMDEEKAFWMLVIITERYLPGIHEFNLEGVNVHQGVLMLCLRQYLPEVWALISDEEHSGGGGGLIGKPKTSNAFLYDLPPLSFCTTSWFMSVFVGVLPIETTLRVWDCLFYEDSKTLFQVSLTIFKILEPQMMELSHSFSAVHGTGRSGDDDAVLSAELFQVIQNTPKRLLDANGLLEECFRLSNFSRLTQQEILNCKKYVVESRTRYHELIKKRSAIGLSESDRRDLVRSAALIENKQVGLKSMNWNGRINNRMRRIQHKLK